MEVSLPTDSDGFLSQECPSCGQQFKVIFGEGSSNPISRCPYCGHRGENCWYTTQQVEHLKAVAASTVLGPQMKKLASDLKQASNGWLKFELKGDVPAPPPAPMETDDTLDVVRFPCCNETVKLIRQASLFCIICGMEFDMAASESTKVFLSHKGVDKQMVSDFKKCLEEIGYAPWLDDDAMPAGTSLERGLLKGMQDSCGVVFFLTPSFKDEGYLETEVNYAIQQKREKGERFRIISLQFVGDGSAVGDIPELLKGYVWKKPQTQLEALREIIRALPVVPGRVDWRDGITGVVTLPTTKSTRAELSEEANAILQAAAAGDGHIICYRTMGGQGIQTNGQSLIPDADPRTVAHWVGGIEDLQRRRYIKALGHEGNVFEVTREGYEAADSLKQPK